MSTAITPPVQTAEFFSRTRRDAPLLWVFGVRVRILVDSAATSGRYSLMEIYAPPFTDGPPPHSHDDFDELFHVMEGGLKVFVSGAWHVAHAGDTVIVPRGTLHTYNNPFLSACRFLAQCTPGGFENFFLEIGTPVTSTGVEPIRPPGVAAPDLERIKSLARKHRMHMPGLTD